MSQQFALKPWDSRKAVRILRLSPNKKGNVRDINRACGALETSLIYAISRFGRITVNSSRIGIGYET